MNCAAFSDKLWHKATRNQLFLSGLHQSELWCPTKNNGTPKLQELRVFRHCRWQPWSTRRSVDNTTFVVFYIKFVITATEMGDPVLSLWPILLYLFDWWIIEHNKSDTRVLSYIIKLIILSVFYCMHKWMNQFQLFSDFCLSRHVCILSPTRHRLYFRPVILGLYSVDECRLELGNYLWRMTCGGCVKGLTQERQGF